MIPIILEEQQCWKFLVSVGPDNNVTKSRKRNRKHDRKVSRNSLYFYFFRKELECLVYFDFLGRD